jgi:hypothetical protein
MKLSRWGGTVSDLYPDQQDWKEPECDEACGVVNGLRSELEQVRRERDEALTKLDEATGFDGIMRQIDTYYPLEVPYFHDSNDPGCVAMRAQRQCLLATERAEKAEAERDQLAAEGRALEGRD